MYQKKNLFSIHYCRENVATTGKTREGIRGRQGTLLRTYGNINYRYFKIMIDNLHISVIFGFTQNILAYLFSI